MKILVIGDSCEDIFRYGKVNRLAPEAPVPVIIPENEKQNPGMAGNVFRNIKSLGCEVDLITNLTPIKKIRYVCSKYNHLLLRVDENDICENISSYILENIKWDEYDAVVISDYCKGFLNKNDIRYISEHHPLTFLDTKKLLGNWAHNVSYIKINFYEHERNTSILHKNKILKNKIITTLGKKGCSYQDKIYPTQEVPVKDISGAGDTFLAGLVVKYVRSKNIELSIKFAQHCTTIVVQKLGVSII